MPKVLSPTSSATPNQPNDAPKLFTWHGNESRELTLVEAQELFEHPHHGLDALISVVFCDWDNKRHLQIDAIILQTRASVVEVKAPKRTKPTPPKPPTNKVKPKSNKRISRK